MPDVRIVEHGRVVGWLSYVGEYKPGDQPPMGYIDRQEWADVQIKAGLKQEQCSLCGKWNFPQQIASVTEESQTAYRTKRDAMKKTSPVTIKVRRVTCNECSTKGASDAG